MTIKLIATSYLTAVNICLTPYALCLYAYNKWVDRYADKNKAKEKTSIAGAKSNIYKIDRVITNHRSDSDE